LSYRWTRYLVAAVLVALAAHQVTRAQPFNVIVGVLLVAGAVGLLRGVRWGRRFAVAFLWLLLLAALGDVLPARIEADQALGGPPATSAELWTQLIALGSVALASLHFLGKHKGLFRAEWW
jgi:hypothetical protein